ncbi:MAG: hypothetical protein WC506_02600 [Candidatus Micrarchaeia archaeon]
MVKSPFNAGVVFLFILALAAGITFSQAANVQVLVSNATYGDKIYVLVYDYQGYVTGEVHAISPSNLVKTATLSAGQATFDADEAGRWDIYYLGKLYPAYVSDNTPAGAGSLEMPRQDWFAQLLNTAISLPVFAVVLALILVGSLVFLYFFVNSYSARQFSVRKAVSKGKVGISIKNNGPEARNVLLLDFFEEGGRLMCVQKKIGKIGAGQITELSYPSGKNSHKYSAKVVLLSTTRADDVSYSAERD